VGLGPEHDWSRCLWADALVAGFRESQPTAAQRQCDGSVRLMRSQAMEQECIMRKLLALIFLLPMLAWAQSSLPNCLLRTATRYREE